jgi:uncharacterized DUF497 family protein
VRFEWDENKAESNAWKHGITFEEAVTVFADPYLLFAEDSLHSDGEEREWAQLKMARLLWSSLRCGTSRLGLLVRE